MIDEYDTQHPETGSSNISKATSEWKGVLERARRQWRPGRPPVLHLAYGLIDEQIKAGIPWTKCPNCGSPFRTDYRSTGNVCSDECWDAYAEYLNTGLDEVFDQ